MPAGAAGLEGGPPLVGEPVAEQLVRKFGLGDRGTSSQGEGIGCGDGLEATVDFGVDPAHEERSDAVHAGEVAAGTGVLLEDRQVGGAHGAGGVTSQLRRDFDRHEPVETAADIEHRSQYRKSLTQIVDHQIPIRVDYRSAASSQRRELVVVGVGPFDGLRENGRVGRDAADAVAHETGQGAIAERRASQVVKPRALTLLVE